MITDLPDTTASAVDKKLIDLREHAGVTTLGRVLTLIIVTTDGRFDEPLEAAVRASHEHPARMIVLDIDADSADSGLDAEIRLGSDAGSGEVVILRARGDVVTGLDTLLTPLLLPDAPIVAWWPCSPPSAPCQDVVGSLAQRRITDALSAKDPEAVLKRLRRGYSRGDSDMTWSRLTTWRGLIATAYEVPPVSAPTSVVVEGDPANPSVILMAAWLEEMLDTEVRVEENRDGVSGLVAVRLHREDGDIELRRDSEEGLRMDLPGSAGDQRITSPLRSLSDCLAEELRRLDPDVVYGEVLARAFPGIQDPSTYARDKPAPTDRVSPDASASAQEAARDAASQLAEAITERGIAHLVLTGGGMGVRTATALATELQAREVDLSALHVWWGDERYLPAEDADRNDEQVREGFLEVLGLDPHRVHRMPTSGSGMTIEDAASWYGQQLDLAGADTPFHTRGRAFFDVLMLGVGPDAHIASLFPQNEAQRNVTASAIPVQDSPKPPPQRVSLSWPAVNSARHVQLLVSGEEKAEAVHRGHGDIDPWEVPASAVRGLESTVWYLDEAAAGDL